MLENETDIPLLTHKSCFMSYNQILFFYIFKIEDSMIFDGMYNHE